MLRLRPYKNCDADIIASWIKMNMPSDSGVLTGMIDTPSPERISMRTTQDLQTQTGSIR